MEISMAKIQKGMLKNKKHLELVYKNMYNKNVERRTISSEKEQKYQVKEKME